MNRWNKLLAALDDVFGFANKKNSSVKKRRQYFDEKSNEHVFLIEYRVMRGESVDEKKRKAKRKRDAAEEEKLRVADKLQTLDLLKRINGEVNGRVETGDAPPEAGVDSGGSGSSLFGPGG